MTRGITAQPYDRRISECLNSRKDKGGVLTPAIAFGHSLVDRLKAHGFRFEVTAL